MASLDLSPIEARILGCLLEKERTTPENYPLSINSLVAACNQTTNREPVTAYDEKTVESTLGEMREKKLVTVVFGSGSRVQKYRHNLADLFNLTRQDTAVMCVLLLRGPQTGGELRARTERLYHFASLEELDNCLAALQAGDAPLVKLLPQQPGQKERRFVQLFSAEPDGGWQVPTVIQPEPRQSAGDSRLQTLEAEVAALRHEVAELKAQVDEFRKLIS